MRTALFAVLAHVVACGVVLADDAPDVLARQAQEILVKHCTKCHGKVNPQSGFSVLDFEGLTTNGYIVGGKLNDSQVWERVSTNDDSLVMPPTGAMPAEDKAILQKWIEGGAAPFPPDAPGPRPIVPLEEVYAAIEKDLRGHAPFDQPNLRYFSLTHLHNNPGVSDRDLRMFRAALAKLVNSLSWEPSIIHPEPVDAQRTIYRINLVKLGWHKNRLWNKLLGRYPYGMSHITHRDTAMKSMAQYIYDATGTNIPVIRVDWFVANASQPPLYEDMLGLPTGPGADVKLEKFLGVDVKDDFINDREQRAGFIKSNVSEHNRLVARHSSRYGAYWKSYDFKSTAGKQNLLENPLGPAFDGTRFDRYAFQHDGGELIFNLPNGFQAYLLIDGNGKYIQRGPIDVVFDAKQPLNNKEVINGISCMVCHVTGMQDFQDVIRNGHGLTGQFQEKVDRLYPEQKEWARILKDDRSRFMRAYEQACGEYLTVDEDKDKPLEKFPEPVGAIAKQYIQDLTFTDVVAELGHRNVDELKLLFSSAPEFRRYGLAVLPQGQAIKRETWDKLSGISLFQQLSNKLQLGTSERVIAPR